MRYYVKPACLKLVGLETLTLVKTSSAFDQTLDQVWVSQDLGGDGGDCDVQPDALEEFNFILGEITPVGNGILTVHATGGFDSAQLFEFWTVEFDGDLLSPNLTSDSTGECNSTGGTEVYTIPESVLQAKASDGVILVTVTPNDQVECDCPVGSVGTTVSVNLNFQGTSS